jgi:hypothetical protein
MWIECTRLDTKTKVGVNFDNVLRIEPEAGGTRVTFRMDAEGERVLFVVEQFDWLLARLKDGVTSLG